MLVACGACQGVNDQRKTRRERPSAARRSCAVENQFARTARASRRQSPLGGQLRVRPRVAVDLPAGLLRSRSICCATHVLCLLLGIKRRLVLVQQGTSSASLRSAMIRRACSTTSRMVRRHGEGDHRPARGLGPAFARRRTNGTFLSAMQPALVAWCSCMRPARLAQATTLVIHVLPSRCPCPTQRKVLLNRVVRRPPICPAHRGW